ncbi:MAG TPA: chloride channel protein [Bacteroidales bacterium]|nr:chloride channel protein [Bacteroidales bacterium]HPT01693.1 chloride channel protein [Bacteroidales bacterium]
MYNNRLYQKIHSFRLRHISPRTFLVILSVITGAFGGLAAVILKNAVHYLHLLLTSGFNIKEFNLLYLAYPFFGIVITYLFVKYCVKDNISHGISKILRSISKEQSIVKPHNMFTSIIASTFTVGFGGSVGLEAPIVLTGSALGSNLGRIMRLDYKTTTLLVGCGAAGAIAGIFNAPIAAVLFSLEVLMLDLTMASLIPLLLSAATGTTLSYFLMGRGFLFSFHVADPYKLNNLPFYILLGVFTGITSVYFTKANFSLESRFKAIGNSTLRTVTGGLITSLLIFLFPPLFGEGYTSLNALLEGHGNSIVEGSLFYGIQGNTLLFAGFLLLLIIFKVIAMTATNGGGGVGGIFAPSLFVGGVAGYLMALVINIFLPGRLPVENFTLAGMAGVMSGVMHAPLTAIFLIAEITGGYQFFIPLIFTAIVSYLTIMYFEPHSIYTKRLAELGELITHHKDKATLSRMTIENLIETNFLKVSPEATLGELVKIVSQSQRNIFPVVDGDNNFMGVIFINDIRHIIFNHDLYDNVYVSNLMFMPDTFVNLDATMEDLAQKFHDTAHYNIPVLDKGKYVGFVSRANVFSAYRKLVKEFSEE